MEHENCFTLAQVSDVHLGPMPPFWPSQWNVKRALGYINFWTKRRHFNDPSLVERLAFDVKRQSADHIAVTGDLANIGMPAEFVQAGHWLRTVGDPDNVTVIPGNHDIYARLMRDPGVERWRPYMRGRGAGDAIAGLPPALRTGFPFVRVFGRFALIALNSAVPTPPAVASGTVGGAQLDRFAEISRMLHQAEFTRIVLIHHPPLPEHGRRGLTDAAAFDRVLGEVGADLVLHGHNHRAMISWRETATGPVAIVGVGAACDGVYNLYRLERGAGGRCSVEMTVRTGNRSSATFSGAAPLLLDPANARVTGDSGAT